CAHDPRRTGPLEASPGTGEVAQRALARRVDGGSLSITSPIVARLRHWRHFPRTGGRPERALELRLQLDAPGAGVVDVAGEVVDIDAALQRLVVGDVAAEDGRFPLGLGGAVAEAQAAFQLVVVVEFGRLV